MWQSGFHCGLRPAESEPELANDFAILAWGDVVMTMGRYLWRGARRRGWRDRLGRVLLLIALVLLGIALTLGAQGLVGILGSTEEDDAMGALLGAMIPFFAFGIPAGILSAIGAKLAKEEMLIEGSMKADL